MQQLSGKRALALVLALTFGTAGSVLAQDTTETGRAAIDTTDPGAGAIDTAATDTSGVSDTTDTSGVQNPPGYRGMERDTTMFPPEGGPPATPDRAADQTTGGYGDSAGTEQNPPGYRGMETPVGGDSAAVGQDSAESDSATHRMHPSEGSGDTTSAAPDSAQ